MNKLAKIKVAMQDGKYILFLKFFPVFLFSKELWINQPMEVYWYIYIEMKHLQNKSELWNSLAGV